MWIAAAAAPPFFDLPGKDCLGWSTSSLQRTGASGEMGQKYKTQASSDKADPRGCFADTWIFSLLLEEAQLVLDMATSMKCSMRALPIGSQTSPWFQSNPSAIRLL